MSEAWKPDVNNNKTSASNKNKCREEQKKSDLNLVLDFSDFWPEFAVTNKNPKGVPWDSVPL